MAMPTLLLATYLDKLISCPPNHLSLKSLRVSLNNKSLTGHDIT